MQSFHRKILYLYQYRNERRQNNVGFIKLDQRDKHIRVQIKFRLRSGKVPEQVILYTQTKGKMKEVASQELHFCGQASEGEFFVDKELFTQAAGFYLPIDEINFLGVRIDEQEMQMPRFQTNEKKNEIEFAAAQESTKEESTWNKIKREDLGMLPASEWVYATNSFMLGKYEQYGYLMFGTLEGEDGSFLGVPGEYQHRDSYMANLYGFEFFKKEKGSGKPQLGDFGYWLHRINMV